MKDFSLKVLARFVLCAISLTNLSALAQSRHVCQPGSQAVSAVHPAQKPRITEYRLPPDKLAKAEALYKISTELYLFGMIFGVAVLWLLLKLRIAPVFRDLAQRTARNGFIQTIIFVPLFTLLLAIISLPIDIYQHRISLAYGLSVQRWASWVGDWGKAQGVSIVISVFLVHALFWIIRKSPQRWWFYFWLLTLPFIAFIIFISPILLDPLFNRFEPLEKTQPQLVAAIESVTQRGGLNIPRDRMFDMKASEKVTTYNAYVTGIGATKRVVVWDNTARDMTIPETLFIFGHEMGHYVLNHIYKGLAFYAVTSLFGFWLGRKLVTAMLARWGNPWQIRGVNDLAALPVLMLALALLSLVAEPVGNAFSRYQEHQADIYGLEVTHGLFPDNRQVAASSFQKLGEKSFDYPVPNPLLVFWSYSHPSIAERIRFSLQYDPWSTPAGPKFVK